MILLSLIASCCSCILIWGCCCYLLPCCCHSIDCRVTSRGFLDIVDGMMQGNPSDGAIEVVENSVVVYCTIPES